MDKIIKNISVFLLAIFILFCSSCKLGKSAVWLNQGYSWQCDDVAIVIFDNPKKIFDNDEQINIFYNGCIKINDNNIYFIASTNNTNEKVWLFYYENDNKYDTEHAFLFANVTVKGEKMIWKIEKFIITDYEGKTIEFYKKYE